MIFLTRLDGKQFLLNEALVETVNQTPDTIINMNNGHSFVVQESLSEITEKIIAFNRLSKRRISRRHQEETDELS